MTSIYDNVSPLDFRYFGQDEELKELLGPYVTERGRVASEAMVEAAAARVLARRGICSLETSGEIAMASVLVTAEEVAEEEARIHHNVRALVNCIQRRVSDEAKPFVHFTLTSFDVIDTAAAWRLKEAILDAVIPSLNELMRVLIDLARREKDTLQIGRTHGQHAVPITFGFAIAGYVDRLGDRIEFLRGVANDLRGKISGAVGAYNASSLIFDDPLGFERDVLAELGLKPAMHSTQIAKPEYVTDLAHGLISTFGVLADLADDMRHLQRTEISEVGEAFAAAQVGSSTMPHKRNPWNFENVKSMWKEFAPRMQTVYADQLSEHQRDLTNSASGRFLPEIIVGLTSSIRRMTRVMSRLVTDSERMRKNFALTEGMIAAEPAYILLAAKGHPDAHEAVRRMTLEAQERGVPLGTIISESPEMEMLTEAEVVLLLEPSQYVGISSLRTENICDYWEARI